MAMMLNGRSLRSRHHNLLRRRKQWRCIVYLKELWRCVSSRKRTTLIIRDGRRWKCIRDRKYGSGHGNDLMGWRDWLQNARNERKAVCKRFGEGKRYIRKIEGTRPKNHENNEIFKWILQNSYLQCRQLLVLPRLVLRLHSGHPPRLWLHSGHSPPLRLYSGHPPHPHFFQCELGVLRKSKSFYPSLKMSWMQPRGESVRPNK